VLSDAMRCSIDRVQMQRMVEAGIQDLLNVWGDIINRLTCIEGSEKGFREGTEAP
jgi:hypothetical protein